MVRRGQPPIEGDGGLARLSEQRSDALALGDACRSLSRCVLGPLQHLPEPDLVLGRVPINSHSEFSHRPRIGGAYNGNAHGFVQAVRIDIDAVNNALGIRE
jgi:hypothetical protein